MKFNYPLSWYALVLFVFCFLPSTRVLAQLKQLKAGFVKPADQYKPGVYWYFMDGNMSAETITKDLESMKKAGIGNLIFLEVNVGVPRGPVDFLSPEWTRLFLHAEKEARRLGIEITLGIGPGWTGSGGPWVSAAQSMKHLVSSEVIVSPGKPAKIMLPIPAPRKPFFGEDNLTPEFKKEWNSYYEDVAVLAFPLPGNSELISDHDEKALYYRAPYSSGTVKPYLASPVSAKKMTRGATATEKVAAIDKSRMIDLTGRLQRDGSLQWTPPAGRWVVMRFGSRNNGAITRPAPVPGLGFESDKFDTTALNAHLEKYVGKLLKGIGKVDPKNVGGLKRLHMDSWEMGAQNWTARFREEFITRRHYDPLKYYPVYEGKVVGNLAESERFLWDLRQTSQELVLEYHAQQVKAYAHRHHLGLSIEPYDMNPTADLSLGAVADVPMAEFWSKGYGFNSTYSVIEATSVAHVQGKSMVPAEAFTAQDDEGWKQHPASMKDQGDWAFAAGVNRFVYHTFQNQFLPDSLKPGATMGPYGVHWDRSQTWWPMVNGYHDYVTRCQYLLQQGRTVADILYLTPEGAPHVFVPPVSAILGDTIGNRRGYNFDGCSPGQLLRATVKNKQIVFPGGASYRIMVLPVIETMTPQLLAKIESLIREGATVVGPAPLRSPSLSGYPACDSKVRLLSGRIWGSTPNADREECKLYGLGKVIWGGKYAKDIDHLYPSYNLIAKLLKTDQLEEDFSTEGTVRYTHRSSASWDIYFLSNTSNRPIRFDGTFRSVKGSPEVWNAITGKIKAIHDFSTTKTHTVIPLALAEHESCFIVFAKENQWQKRVAPPSAEEQLVYTLTGAWQLSFDPKMGGPQHIVFPALSDWTRNQEQGIKYYSGIATYEKQFDLPITNAGTGERQLYLDLGKVKNMARVTLNGKDLGVVWTAPWRVNVTEALREKNNQLKIEVANLWPNRLIGDEQKPYDGIVQGQWPDWLLNHQPRTSGRFTFTTARHYGKDSPLLESGLLGPVKIVEP